MDSSCTIWAFLRGRAPEAFGSAAGGLLLGSLPLLLLRTSIRRLPFEQAFPPANLLMFTAALQFWFGFGLVHGNFAIGLTAFLLGNLLAIVFKYSQSLWTAVLIHVINNSSKLVLLYILLKLGFNLQ